MTGLPAAATYLIALIVFSRVFLQIVALIMQLVQVQDHHQVAYDHKVCTSEYRLCCHCMTVVYNFHVLELRTPSSCLCF
ncbi:hypothetical protein PIB30_065198 [Stylosanthes scabra]|uniref:Secreted protein n=1 Tax=Stylosanthes scabra TaxID=79078 RepID=A0ABU6QLW4_9FABA|nr:hypothetical protein [Stylosanthes scabra]